MDRKYQSEYITCCKVIFLLEDFSLSLSFYFNEVCMGTRKLDVNCFSYVWVLLKMVESPLSR